MNLNGRNYKDDTYFGDIVSIAEETTELGLGSGLYGVIAAAINT